jgi:hypothetical protein
MKLVILLGWNMARLYRHHTNNQMYSTTATRSAWPRKKEIIGNFKNARRTWCKAAKPALVHGWPQDAMGQAVPYGVYDVMANRGYVCVGLL